MYAAFESQKEGDFPALVTELVSLNTVFEADVRERALSTTINQLDLFAAPNPYSKDLLENYYNVVVRAKAVLKEA